MNMQPKALCVAIVTTTLLTMTGVVGAAEFEPNPSHQLKAIGTKQVDGDSLSVTAIPQSGRARLNCAFQRLEGEATPEGLWLTSTTEAAKGGRFRVVAVSVGRAGSEQTALPASGEVSIGDALVRFIRPGVMEEYSVSVDGVRQDFVALEKLPGTSDLCVELALSGATAAPSS